MKKHTAKEVGSVNIQAAMLIGLLVLLLVSSISELTQSSQQTFYNSSEVLNAGSQFAGGSSVSTMQETENLGSEEIEAQAVEAECSGDVVCDIGGGANSNSGSLPGGN